VSKVAALEVIDSVYHLSNHSDDPALKGAAIAQVHSVDELLHTYVPDIQPLGRLRFKRAFNEFVLCMIHPQRLIFSYEYRGDQDTLQMYEPDTDWLPMRKLNNYRDKSNAIGVSVLPDIKSLNERPYLPRHKIYYHQTTARALDGILRQGAIVSALTLKQKGIIPKSGTYELEQMFTDKEDARGAIYVARSPSLDAYGTLAWFDDSAVSLAINYDKQVAFLREAGIQTNAFNFGPDIEPTNGMMLGPIVPLAGVEEIYGWEREKQRLQEKVAACSHDLSVFSLEAALATNGYAYNLRPLLSSLKS
jgi:hypothetical protein